MADVNGQKISRADFDKKLESGPAGKQTLNQLVQGKLIDQYATDHHIDVSDAEVQKKLDEIKAKMPAGQYDATLKAQGLTQDDVNAILRQNLVIEKAVGKNIKVTDADIKPISIRTTRSSISRPRRAHATSWSPTRRPPIRLKPS